VHLAFFFCFFFALVGSVVPILSENGDLPPPLGAHSFVSSEYLPPDWVEFLPNSRIPEPGNIIPDSNLAKKDSWSFNVSDPAIMSFTYDTEDFMAGNRSVYFSYEDNNDTEALPGNINGSLSFPWAFNPPTNSTISWFMKINVSGTINPNSISPYIRFITKKDNPLYTVPQALFHRVFPPSHSEWMQYRRYLTSFQMIFLFQTDSLVNLEIGVDFRDTNPAYVGSVQVWFDQIELHVDRPTHGLLGTNYHGQDVFIQLAYSVQASFFTAFTVGIISLVVGVIVGILAGYLGGLCDIILMRIVDFLLIYPSLLIIFLLMNLFHVRIFQLPFLIALFTWPATARIVRSKVLVEREQLYIESAKASGANDWYIMFRYILPNILGLIFVQFAMNAATAITLEASLSFMNFPIQWGAEQIEGVTYWISWGFMLAEAYLQGGFVNKAWWTIIPPGLCIVLLGASFLFIGYALDKVFNPHKFRDRSFH
jgi:peptide/nickel transport system permease protein